MATISAYFKLMDQFSSTLNQAMGQIERVGDAAQAASRPIELNVDTMQLQAAQMQMAALSNQMQISEAATATLEEQLMQMTAQVVAAEQQTRTLGTQLQKLKAVQDPGASTIKRIESLQKQYDKQVQSLSKLEAATQKLDLQTAKATTGQAKLAEQIAKSAEKVQKMSNECSSLTDQQEKLTNTSEETASAQRNAATAQEQFNNAMSNSSGLADTLTNKFDGLLKKYLSFQAIKAAAKAIFNFTKDAVSAALEQEQAAISLAGTLGDEVGAAYIQHLRDTAGGFDITGLINNTKTYAGYTQNLRLLDKLNQQSKKLMMLDPMQGIEGAGFAIKEMLGGQFTSLKSRFGFSSSDIEEIKNGAKTIEDVMNNLDKVLERRGSTDETLEKFEQSASSVLDTIKGKFQTRFSEIGAVVLEKLMPALEQVSEWLDSPQADEFFNALASGLALLVGGFLWLAQTGAAAFQWISDHGQILLPILIGLAAGVLLFQAAMAIMNVVMLAGQLAMTSFGNAALLASLKIALLPILIGLLIAGLVHLMKKFEWVREGVALVVGAIVIFFMWMVGEVLRLVQNMVNFVIDAINVLISILNNLPGVNIDMIENATFADDFKAKHADDGVNAANWILDTFGESESTDKAGNPADDLSQMLDDLLNSVGNVDDWANGGSSGGSSGGAPVTVTNDVDEELVKLLREREEGIILRQHYTEDNSMYFENTNLTGVSEGQSMEEVFDEFVTRISEANASQPSQAYGGKAL